MPKKLFLISLISIFFISCNHANKNQIKSSESFTAMNTYMTVSLYASSQKQGAEVCDKIKKRILQLEEILSTTLPQSDVYFINHNKKLPSPLKAELSELLDGISGGVTPLIAHQQFHNLICAEHSLLHSPCHEVVSIVHFRQFHKQKEWYAAKMHLCAGIYRKTCHELRRHLAYKLFDALHPLVLLLIECIAERCSNHSRIEFQLRSHDVCLGTFMVLYNPLSIQN